MIVSRHKNKLSSFIFLNGIFLSSIIGSSAVFAAETDCSVVACYSNGNILSINDSFNLSVAVENGISVEFTNYATGEIYVSGEGTAGIYLYMNDDYNPKGPTGFLRAINEGVIETGEDLDPSEEQLHGIAVGFSIDNANNPQTAGDVFVTNSGTIKTHAVNSRGIYIARDHDAKGTVIVDNSQGTIQTLSAATVSNQLTGDGIYVEGGRADLQVAVGNVEINGIGSAAALVSAGNINAELGAANTVNLKGDTSAAIMARSSEGNVTVTVDGKIRTEGKNSDAVLVSAVPEDFPFGSNDAIITLSSTAEITTIGDQSGGLSTAAANTATLTINGKITLSGDCANGASAGSIGGKTTITVGKTGTIQGGRGGASALQIGSQTGVDVTNNGTLTALSDRLIDRLSDMGQTGHQAVSNQGTMTGFFSLGEAGDNSFTNKGQFISRNFSAQKADGVRNQRGVAINDMGGANSDMVNDTTGVISLGASDADTFDATGYYAARTGADNRQFSQDIYDFSRTGLLQSQFLNTRTFTNRGVMDLTGAEIGNTLVITSGSDVSKIGEGTFVSDGGVLRLAAVLNDGDKGQGSKADMLIADRVSLGSAATTIEVVIKDETNEAKTKANGIQLVQVRDKDHSDAGAFILGGTNSYEHEGVKAIGSGAYAYKLYQNGLGADAGDGNWYLRSQLRDGDEPQYTQGVPVYEAYPQVLLALNSLPTLQQRVGNRYWSHAGNIMIEQGADVVGTPQVPAAQAGSFTERNGIWGRIEGQHLKAKPAVTTSDTNYDVDTYKMQAGLDGVLTETENGLLIGGITVHYGHASAKTYSSSGLGKISTDGYGFGGTLTWYGNEGFYFDTQAQFTWYDSDLSARGVNRQTFANGNNGFGYALSAETGKRFILNDNWSLTPQAQLVYSHVDFDTFTDRYSGVVSLDKGASLQGRVGLTADYQNSWYNSKGTINRSYVYGIANLYYEFLDGTVVDVSSVRFTSRNDRVWGGIGLGGSYNWDNDKYSVYGEGSVNTSLNHFGDSYAYKGTIGLRVKW